jgi:hypothetical protein
MQLPTPENAPCIASKMRPAMTPIRLKFKDQIYECVSVEPYTRVDGSPSGIRTWRTVCAKCGDPFTFTAALFIDPDRFNRRCQAHKRPGNKVRILKAV